MYSIRLFSLALFELQSYGQSIVRLKSLGTGKYLAINWQGKTKMQVRLNIFMFHYTNLVKPLSNVLILVMFRVV